MKTLPMRTIQLLFVAAVILSGVSDTLPAETKQQSLTIQLESEVFARRGETILTQADLDARLDRVPESDRAALLSDRQRISRMVDDELLLRKLADDGIKAGILNDQHVQALLLQAARNLIAESHVVSVLESAELTDYAQQARELWLAGTYRPRTPERFDFTHLLVSAENRSDAEAARLALHLYDRIEQGENFEDLIGEYSEDPSAGDNQGRFSEASVNDLEAEFGATLAEIREGDISEPVRTRFGWHIVRLDRRHPSRELEFEAALPELKEISRQRHRENVRDRYYANLFDQPREIAADALQKLLERYGVSDNAYE